MMISYDLYSETNPAFVSFLIYRFVRAYKASDYEDAPHFSLVYLAIPIATSNRLQMTFSSTNVKTGLLSWINRYPEIRIGLMNDVEAARDFTTEGLRAAIHSELLAFGPNGSLQLGVAKPLAENIKTKLPSNPKNAVSRVERLAKWMASAGSPSHIFSLLEVAP